MTGMGGPSSRQSQQVAAAFNHSLWEQLFLVLLISSVATAITIAYRRQSRQRGWIVPEPSAESSARSLLRIGTASLWVIAGLLQLQPEMPLGVPMQIIAPSAAHGPGWLRHLADFIASGWIREPTTAAGIVVWLQLGLGVWLIAADRGWSSRVAGLVSAIWASAIWLVGTSMGGIFVPPVGWMFGAPGATAFYAVAGVALALPLERFESREATVRSSRGIGFVLLGFAILQAWPDQGYWSGRVGRSLGPIAEMARQMSTLTQPSAFSSVQRHVASVAASWSWTFDLAVLVGLVVSGILMLVATSRSVRIGAWIYTVLAVLDWLVIQDLGFFGGLGTDLNSMLPSALLVVTGAMALRSSAPAGPTPIRRKVSPQSEARLAMTVSSASVVVTAAVSLLLVVSLR